MPKGRYYEYQIKRASIDDAFLSNDIDSFQYKKLSLELDLQYEDVVKQKIFKDKLNNYIHDEGLNNGAF
tara:strand:+ start:706 stop:912 length:207 start_codon:yes stop_codon:yes gene_type:complete